MKNVRTERTGRRPVRLVSIIAGAVAILAAAPVSFPAVAAAQANSAALPAGQGIEDFYAARGGAPLWVHQGDSEAAQKLVALLRTADADGLDPRKYDADALAAALSRASSGHPREIRKADAAFSRALVAYASDLRNAPAAGMQFVDRSLQPSPPSPRAILEVAAAAPSLSAFVDNMGWMNSAYAPLRRALASGDFRDDRQRALLRINLERARVLPAGGNRYVIVNAAEQRLYMYEDNKLIDSMKVVVGKQKDNNRTPMMASVLRQASLNPYWNVPPDLAAERIAPNVVKLGLRYLKSHGYELLSDWGDRPSHVDPATVDWQAVVDGRVQVRLRQVPGPGNALGKVKYTFPNPYGIYLHDTPDKQLLAEDTRLFSGGCIRLEDAGRFGEWLFGHRLEAESRDPDIKVTLDRPVPVYVTYLTAVPGASSITFLDDVYGWDAQRLAQMGSSSKVAAR